MSEQLEVRYVPLGTVMLWDRNPKRHSIGDLAASIERYGFKEIPKYEPRLNNGQGGIVAGNGRIETLAALHQQGKPAPRGIVEKDGEWLVPITFGVDAASQEEAEAYGLDSNNLGLSGGDFTAYDMARLWGDGYTDILSSLALSSSLPITVDGDALDGLLAAMIPEVVPGGGGDDFDTTPADGPARCKAGDLWAIGPHRLLVGDCTDPANVARLMGGERADIGIFDPPYGMAYEPNHDARRVKHNYNGAGYHNVKHQSMITGDDEDYDPTPIMALFKEVKEQFWWGADYYRQYLPSGGSWLVWDKRHGIEDMDFNTSHFELCWSKGRHLREIIRCKWFGIQGTEQQDVRERVHPTQKPLQVYIEIIKKHAATNALIVDTYIGSGTTLIAAHRTGRRCYGMEISLKYCDVILRRATAEGLECVLLEHQDAVNVV